MTNAEKTSKCTQEFAYPVVHFASALTAAARPLVCFQFDNEGVEADADNVVNQVLAEIGLDVDGKMMDAPTGAPAVARPAAAGEAKLDAKTEEMLAQLGAL